MLAPWRQHAESAAVDRCNPPNYKRQWGLTPHYDRMSPLIALRADLAHPGVASALEREPLLTLTDDGFGRIPG